MMTISQAPRKGGGAWALQAALVFSLLVHLAVFVLGSIGYDSFAMAFQRPAPAQQQSSEIVTITAPVTIEHRQLVPHQLRRAVRAPAGFSFPRSAFGSGRPFGHMRAPNAQVAARAQAPAVLDNPEQVPAKYRLSMRGKNAKLKRGQGIYFPTRGWRENGLDYYEVSYEFVYPSGVDEKGAVPWPIHFDPASDPFFSPDFEALRNTPLPSPPPGFVPPGDLGKALRAYFPNLHFEDQDN